MLTLFSRLHPFRLSPTMKVEFCSFSGYKIYPGQVRLPSCPRSLCTRSPLTHMSTKQGRLFVRSDSKIYRCVLFDDDGRAGGLTFAAAFALTLGPRARYRLARFVHYTPPVYVTDSQLRVVEGGVALPAAQEPA